MSQDRDRYFKRKDGMTVRLMGVVENYAIVRVLRAIPYVVGKHEFEHDYTEIVAHGTNAIPEDSHRSRDQQGVV